MAQVSNKTLMMIIFVLSIVFIFTLLYGCSCTYEKFEVSGPAPAAEEEVVDQTMKKVSDQMQQEDKEKEDAAYTKAAEEVKQALQKASAPSPAPATVVRAAPSTSPAPAKGGVMETLNSKEKELFDQITSNNMSGEELNKLIAAGIVTEQMIEKFLNQLDMDTEQEVSEEKIEPFCSGECYAKYA